MGEFHFNYVSRMVRCVITVTLMITLGTGYFK